MAYKFVTREEIEHAIKCMGEISLPLRALIDRVFAERDAYREVTIIKIADQHLLSGCKKECQHEDLANEIDAEATRLIGK